MNARPKCPLLERFERTVRIRPNATAVLGADSPITYREVRDSVMSWADRWSAQADRVGGVAVIVTDGNQQMPAAFLGARAAGLVPLLVDSLLPRSRREAMIDAARPAARTDLTSDSTVEAGVNDPRALPAPAGYLVFTSGSQSTPKGIIGNIDGLLRFLDWQVSALRIGRHHRVAMLASPSFDVVLREMLLPLLTGGELHPAGPLVRTDHAQVVDWLRDREVNVVHLVPSLSLRWTESATSVLPDLEWSLFAGEPLHERHVARWRALARASRIINLYGPSETTLAKFWHEVNVGARPGFQPVGRPLPGTKLLRYPLIDGERSAPDEFRIGIETEQGSLGYLDGTASETDRANLVRHRGTTVFVTQDRGWLSSEDLLHVEGRLDGLVKRRGVLVDTAGIVTAALAVPEVIAACCLQTGAENSGDLTLTVECEPGFTVRALRSHLVRALGPAMPDDIVVLASIPLLPNGKADVNRIREHLVRRSEQPA